MQKVIFNSTITWRSHAFLHPTLLKTCLRVSEDSKLPTCGRLSQLELWLTDSAFTNGQRGSERATLNETDNIFYLTIMQHQQEGLQPTEVNLAPHSPHLKESQGLEPDYRYILQHVLKWPSWTRQSFEQNCIYSLSSVSVSHGVRETNAKRFKQRGFFFFFEKWEEKVRSSDMLTEKNESSWHLDVKKLPDKRWKHKPVGSSLGSTGARDVALLLSDHDKLSKSHAKWWACHFWNKNNNGGKKVFSSLSLKKEAGTPSTKTVSKTLYIKKKKKKC